MLSQMTFYFFATVALLSGLFVVMGRNPVSCAIALIATLGSIAALFVTLDAHFLAIIQILVYAGAIMVLFVFVIMLLNLPMEERQIRRWGARSIIGLLMTLGCAVIVGGKLASSLKAAPRRVDEAFGTIETVGQTLFTQYLIPFEVISLLLTAAVVGAVVIAKREI